MITYKLPNSFMNSRTYSILALTLNDLKSLVKEIFYIPRNFSKRLLRRLKFLNFGSHGTLYRYFLIPYKTGEKFTATDSTYYSISGKNCRHRKLLEVKVMIC